MEIVKEITDTKTGMGKKGPWVLTKYITKSDKRANIFDNVEVGDEVELTEYSETYKTWGSRKPKLETSPATNQQIASNEVIARLNEFAEILDRIERRVILLAKYVKGEATHEESPF